MELKKQRTAAGMTQKELASKCGVARNTISMIETGVNNPSPKLAKKFAQVFNVSWTLFF